MNLWIKLLLGSMRVAAIAASSARGQERPTGPTAPSAVRFGTPAPAVRTPTVSPLPEPAASPAIRTTAEVPGFPMIDGQEVQPIDLANALRLAWAHDLDIATARQHVLRSVGDLDQARGLWLPSLFTGPTY